MRPQFWILLLERPFNFVIEERGLTRTTLMFQDGKFLRGGKNALNVRYVCSSGLDGLDQGISGTEFLPTSRARFSNLDFLDQRR